MAPVREYLDEAVHTVVACGPGGVVVHYVHECDDDGAGDAELGVTDDADFLLVSSLRYELLGELLVRLM